MPQTSKTLMPTLFVRYFGWRWVPMLAFIRPVVIELSEERVVIKIPLIRRTKNHLGSMYFGVLAAGADLAAGFVAIREIGEIGKSGIKIAMVFKDVQGRFLKRVEGDAHFVCQSVQAIKALAAKANATGERQEITVPIDVLVPSKLGEEPAAQFALTLSLKKKN